MLGHRILKRRSGHVLPLAAILVCSAGAATAVEIDWRTSWYPAADVTALHFSYDCGGYSDLQIKGNFAYAASRGRGLQILDITDPLNPLNRGFAAASGMRERIAILDNYVFASLWNPDRILVIDVDDHDAPVVPISLPVDGDVNDLLVVGRLLYAALEDGRLLIYDADDQLDLQLLLTLQPPAGAIDAMELAAGRLYGAGEGLVVYDVTTPGAPSLLGSLPFTGWTRALAVRDGLAVVGQWSLTRLIDVNDPAAMFELTTLPYRGLGAYLSGGLLWLGLEGCWGDPSIDFYDVTNPAQPELIHEVTYGMRGWPTTVIATHGYLFAAETMCWCAGEWPSFYVFRPGTLPPAPPLATLEQAEVACLLAAGGLLYAGAQEEIVVRDVADPTAPLILGTFAPGRRTTELIADGSRLVALEHHLDADRLQLYDRTEGWEPNPRGHVALGVELAAVATAGDYALIAEEEPGGLRVVDITEPDVPVVVTTHYAGQVVRDVAVAGSLAAVRVDGDVLLLDVTDPVVPVQLASIGDVGPNARGALLLVPLNGGLYLFCSNSWINDPSYQGALEIWDVTVPASRERVVYQPFPQLDFINDLTWRDGVLYAQGQIYLSIFAWSGPESSLELLGRVDCDFLFPYHETRRFIAMADAAVVSAFEPGNIQLWPLQETAAASAPNAPDAPPPPAGSTLTAVPNPFNPATEIRFDLPVAGFVDLAVYDLRGRLVRRLVSGDLAASAHAVTWRGRDEGDRRVAAGVYVARLRTAAGARGAKVVLVE